MVTAHAPPEHDGKPAAEVKRGDALGNQPVRVKQADDVQANREPGAKQSRAARGRGRCSHSANATKKTAMKSPGVGNTGTIDRTRHNTRT